MLERRLKEERQAATEEKIAAEQQKAEILSECETKVAIMQISSQHLRERATKAENDLSRETSSDVLYGIYFTFLSRETN